MHNLVIIYLTGMLGIWKAIPVGIILNASPLSICLMTILGASTTVVVIYLFGGWVRQFVLSKLNKNKLNKTKTKTNKLLARYGVIGLGLFGTMTMGPNMTILLGLIAVKARIILLAWIIIGILVWTAILTTAAALSFELFERIVFFQRFSVN
jgi:membrane protein YqaA with SNARE-associated domain